MSPLTLRVLRAEAGDGAVAEEKLPVIIMAHGFSAVKEMGLPDLA